MAVKLLAKRCNIFSLRKYPQIHSRCMSTINTFQSLSSNKPLHQIPFHRSFCTKTDPESNAPSENQNKGQTENQTPNPEEEEPNARNKWLKRLLALGIFMGGVYAYTEWRWRQIENKYTSPEHGLRVALSLVYANKEILQIFGDEIYILKDDKLPPAMEEIGAQLSKIKLSSKHTEIAPKIDAMKEIGAQLSKIKLSSKHTEMAPKIDTQFTITNKDQSVTGKYNWGMQFEYVHSMENDDLFKAEVKYMKAIINIDEPNKEIVVFDGEWTSKNPEAEQMMIDSGEVLFDERNRMTHLFVDKRM
eukprot:CAMPEP_0201593300 /NCGR_PEP_ID=MMETSP0190_2-20130828/190947_1 /ASSEMBLY_ACC=CAM_ASM_000263 /TAXON_ID=37353 /ORGANISM="Rosalina sp." /LENGTH=302 /DNA_ID=CAMNT_0048052437 /DNA_START=21 /DNA_END=930 /DNA_ORIENTATION=+